MPDSDLKTHSTKYIFDSMASMDNEIKWVNKVRLELLREQYSVSGRNIEFIDEDLRQFKLLKENLVKKLKLYAKEWLERAIE